MTICEALEEALNGPLATELSGYLRYEKYEYDGRESGDSRNESYERTIHLQFGPLHVNIPRDRNGSFSQQTILAYSRRTDMLEDTIFAIFPLLLSGQRDNPLFF